MIWKTHETIEPNDFPDYTNAHINSFDIRPNGVILYYTKDNQSFSLAGADFKAIRAQWELGMI